MSAECGHCGRDIEYPPGSWPLGECSYCRLADERDRYEAALCEIANYVDEPGYQKSSDQRKIIRLARATLAAVPSLGEHNNER